ncbi:efflux RND transporter periplasmic adaptor subunit [Shewanella sp. Choline-02u-19]|uniref:efflux RND transporter periplasmic adaptor subunit n=1 Tax=unclassified Shewanella TaxID=196818 RepID=UPI000C333F39|nr:MULTISPECIES: efflux RND transporter periplasmic adaptor subunit [unclassified Shewanella]PKG57778.1 efflux RND transporter periplasmic adaptor subunit [Shewanella sp. GutDb-MelDb]PKG74305.1 efflux RND transporter periplasmic adaptor subunit [Shewanella sp. GutCb]PKH55958.1 efflux RND transporter periplasmic adaptor subunit [Shewanella sp. Bg11-22]PKI27404.1 efflux RND transporter periplasmic adaptor subunit [Shewanella sp. Choline-02u-19]
MNHPTSKIVKFAVAPLALVITSACSQAPASVHIDMLKPERPVQVMTLDNTQQASIKQFSGVLEATQTANLAFKVSGTIEAILVKTGDIVEKGQVLARLEPHDYQVNVVELQARLAEANAAHHLAKVELDRVEQAIADDAISKVNLDRAQSGFQRSLAMVDVVTQNLQKSQDALDYTELKAPFSGVIGAKFQQTFEQTASGAAVFSLHQPNELKAIIDVPENLMGQLMLSQQASVSWHGEEGLTSILSAMDTLPDPIKQTYNVEFVIEQPTDALPGKAVNVAVNFNNEQVNYCVPYAALIQDKAGKSVYVIKDTTVIETAVTVQSLQSNSVCLSGDLHVGDAIVTAGVNYLQPNQTVTKTVVKAFSY